LAFIIRIYHGAQSYECQISVLVGGQFLYLEVSVLARSVPEKYEHCNAVVEMEVNFRWTPRWNIRTYSFVLKIMQSALSTGKFVIVQEKLTFHFWCLFWFQISD